MPDGFASRLAATCRGALPFDEIARTVCAELRRRLPAYHWVGVYMIEGGDTLVLRGWDGPEATRHRRIPVGEGLCGLAARERRTVVVDDVRKDPRYLQCFLRTRAEIVVPIWAGDGVVGEIDVDSDREAAFGETDRVFLDWVAEQLGAAWERVTSSRGTASGTSPPP